jgi:ATP-binding cassette subfamily B protein AbcA/BmrA
MPTAVLAGEAVDAAPLEPKAPADIGDGEPRLRHLFEVIRQARPPTRLIGFAAAISLVEVAATLIFPLVTKNIIDGLSQATANPAAILSNPQVHLLLLMLVCGAVAGAVSTFLLAKAGLAISVNLKSHLAKTLLRQRVDYFDAHQSGEHVSRITNDAGTISNLLTKDFQGFLVGVMLLVGSATVLAVLDLGLALVIFAIIAVGFAVMAPIVVKMTRIARSISDGNARLSATLARTFGEIRLVKAYTAEAVEQERSERGIRDLYRSNLRAAKVQAALTPITSLALTFGMLAIFTYGGGRVALGTLTVGTLTAFVLYIFNIVAPLIQLSTFFSSLSSAKGASQRIHEILAQPAETEEPRPAMAVAPIAVPQADLSFRNVELIYAGASGPSLRVDGLVIPQGRSTAVIGPSGSGKTSLVSLIERFYEPAQGSICWGDTDIRDVPLDAWRASLGYVAQNAPMMAGTIRANIEYGQPPREEICLIRAAEAANCMDFISRLEGGLDADVGEAGIKLSGGQRQRIAIARIFMRDPRILLLDEATSNLDLEGEDAVLAALRRLMMGRTTLVVTHRLSTLSHVDYIAIVEAGRVVEFGSRDDVIGNSSYYRRVSEYLTP